MVQAYETALKDFCAFCESEGMPSNPLEVGVDEVRQWIVNLRTRAPHSPAFGTKNGNHLSDATVSTYVKNLRAFYHFAVDDKRLKKSKDPFPRVKVPKPGKRVPRLYEKEDIAAMLDLCPPNTWWGARDRALLVGYLYTGLRLSELAGIRLRAMDMEARTFIVLGKGNKERQVGVPAPVASAVLRWLEFRPDVDHDFLFTTNDGRPIGIGAIQQMVRKLKIRAGVTGVPRSVHALRHTFAVHALMEGRLPMKLLQEILGHEDPRSTQVYLDAVDDLMAAQVHQDMPIYEGWDIGLKRHRRRRTS